MPDEDNNVDLDTPIEEQTTEPSEPEEVEVDVEQLQKTNKKLFERAKNAEADLKAFKAKKPADANPQVSVEETVLLATGMPEELLKDLKAVATVRGVSLIKAQTDPLFVAVKDEFEKGQRQKDASLPASRNSGTVKPKKSFDTVGLSREEHREMVMKNL